jgi:hypothetical protein
MEAMSGPGTGSGSAAEWVGHGAWWRRVHAAWTAARSLTISGEVLARLAVQLPGDRRERLCVTFRVGAGQFRREGEHRC